MTVQGRYPVPAEYGTRVRWRQQETSCVAGGEGEGVFTLAWLGIEEVWDVRLDDGTTLHLHPCYGDTMEPVGP